METPKIKGPHDNQWFYHTSSEGLVWSDKKGNPIPLSCTLDLHIEAIDPSELWNSIQTWSKVHKQSLPALGNDPTYSTSIDANAPILMTPSSPIMECHVEVSYPEGSSMTTVKDLLEDPQIQPGMMWSTLSTVTSLSTPSKLPSAGDKIPVATTNMPVGSTPNVEILDMNRELSSYKERLALELTNFKKHLETQSHIEIECAKQNLKSEFGHELQHQTLAWKETINALQQVQLWQQQVATHSLFPQAPPLLDAILSPSHPYILTTKQCHHLLVAWLKSWMYWIGLWPTSRPSCRKH